MMTDANTLAQQILDLEDFEAVCDLLEAHLAPGEQRPELLYALRALAYDLEPSWRTMLTAARMAPLPVAISAHTYGRYLNMNESWTASIPPLRVARRAYRWAGDDDGTARAGATLADSLYICSKYDAARAAAEEAEAIFVHAGRHFETGKCRLTIASTYADQLDSKHARAAFEAAAVSLQMAGEQHPHAALALADTYIGLGSMREKLLDDFVGAAAAYTRAEAILDRLRDRIPADQIGLSCFRLHIHRAITDLRLGHHTNVRRELDRAESFLPLEDTINRFEVWLYRGYQALLLGNTKTARQLLDRTWRQARQQAEEQDNALHQRYLEQQVRAAMCAGSGLDLAPDDALMRLDEAAELCLQLEIALWPAIIAMEQARIAYTAGRIAEARGYLERAHTLLAQQQQPSRRRLLEVEVVRSTFDPNTSMEALRQIAEELHELSDHAPRAEVLKVLGTRLERAEAADDAYQAYIAALAAIEQARSSLRLSPHSIPFLATRRLPYERAYALAAKHDPMAAFAISERVRAQTLLDELANNGVQTLLNRDDPRLARLRTLRTALEHAHARAASFTTSLRRSEADDETLEQREERQRLEERYAEELLSLQAAGSDEAAWIRGQIADPSTIQQMLDEGTAIIAYLLVGEIDKNQQDLWATVLTARDKPLAIKVASHRDMYPFLRQWQETSIFDCDLETANGLLARLYKLFFGQLAGRLDSYRRLILVPDEALPLLPLHAAWNRDDGYLVERRVVSYAPSASVLMHCWQREQERACGIGASLAGWEGPAEHRLGYVEHELRDLAPLLDTMPQHDLCSTSAFLAGIADARLIHIACHGAFPRDSPLFAHLLIGQESKLYAHDLYSQRLRADLLTFSACDTGQHGPGLQGLVSAALVSGASAVLASMWPADDRGTRTLMRAFYSALIHDGAGRADALRAAQRQMIGDPVLSAPAIWAPFFLTGVPGPLRAPSR